MKSNGYKPVRSKPSVLTQIRPSVVTPKPAMSETRDIDSDKIGSVGMSNVLSEEKAAIIALGMLGWPLRRIEQATGVRRETASAYLKSAGVVVWLPGWGRRAPAKPAIGVTTDFGQPISPPTAQQDRATSACELYRELIEQGLGRGRNAMAIWPDLVSDHGFPHGYQNVKRFVRKLRGAELPQAVGIIHPSQGRGPGRLWVLSHHHPE
jgi:hypothetical protein